VRRRPLGRLIAAAAVLVAGMVAAGVSQFSPPPTPGMIALLPPSRLRPEEAGPHQTQEALAETTAPALSQRHHRPGDAWPFILPFRSAHKQSRDIATELGVARQLHVSERNDRVTLFFLDAISGQKIWVKDYPASTLATREALQGLARQAATDFASRP